jgi:hypothetical protein
MQRKNIEFKRKLIFLESED